MYARVVGPLRHLSLSELRRQQDDMVPGLVGVSVETGLSVVGMAVGAGVIYAGQRPCHRCTDYQEENVVAGLVTIGVGALSGVISAILLAGPARRFRHIRTAMSPEIYRLFHHDDVSIDIDVEATDDGGALTVLGTY